jgi:hypothetical protein
MGILDEAIREHLELKRQHGADDSELKQLEDQAFGQAERPGADPAAEAPTEFMTQPDLGEGGEAAALPAEASPPVEGALNQEPPAVRREPAAGMADIQEPPATEEAEAPSEPVAEEEPAAAVEPPAEEQPAAEQTAEEHEAIPEPQGGAGSHTTEERHAIADQPTQMYDVEGEFAAGEAPAPPDEDLVAEELTEARLAPAEPLPPPPPAEEDDDDFFDEQRLSEELDQALEAPLEPEPEPEPAPEPDPEPAEPESEEHETVAAADEDVLEETPDFLEQAPEDDQLWFEQKPPKDFDFDD